MYWCSSAESEKFVKSIEDEYEKVKRAGPNPLRALSKSEKTNPKDVISPN